MRSCRVEAAHLLVLLEIFLQISMQPFQSLKLELQHFGFSSSLLQIRSCLVSLGLQPGILRLCIFKQTGLFLEFCSRNCLALL